MQGTTNLFTCRCSKHQVVVDGVGLDSIHQVQDRYTRGNARVLEAADAGGLTCIPQLRRKGGGRVREKVGGRDGGSKGGRYGGRRQGGEREGGWDGIGIGRE